MMDVAIIHVSVIVERVNGYVILNYIEDYIDMLLELI